MPTPAVICTTRHHQHPEELNAAEDYPTSEQYSPGQGSVTWFAEYADQRKGRRGTTRVVRGRMRPSIALKSSSGSGHHDERVRTGLPMPPNATGAEFAIRHSTSVWKDEKSQSDHHGSADCDGSARSARAPSRSRAERERNQRRLQSPVIRDAANRLLDESSNLPDSTATS